MSTHQEAAFAGGTTGPYNVIVIVVCRDANALFDYIAGPIGALAGLERVEPVPITAIAERAAPLV
ncbi:hypothetical protein [Nocardia sp. NPDC058497]|uniref:hypothetical protein n=1 Tax=Nocardia sp. NPDC058497 TaxID=3346529 RepID=UPI00364F1ACB